MPPPLVFEWLIDTLYKVISMQRVQSFSLPNQIRNDDKLRCLHYQWNSGRHSSAFFFSCFPLSCLTWSCLYQPFFFHDIQLLSLLQWQDGDSALAEHPACVATSQLLLRDITADNLLWIFITLIHTDTHTHTPLIKKSSLSCRCAAQPCWNAESVAAPMVWFCWTQFSATRRTRVPSPNISRICSAEKPPWLP